MSPDGGAGDLFGSRLDMSPGDIAVGATGYPAYAATGAVYVFRNIGGRWLFLQKLTASDGQPGDAFGGVAMDGTRLAVSATIAWTGSVRGGAVYLFERTNERYVEVQKLSSSRPLDQARFGRGLSFAGEWLLVGANRELVGGVRTGAVYVFKRESDGVWRERARLAPPDSDNSKYFGEEVVLSGATALVSAPWDSNQNGRFAGAAYVYERDTSGWRFVQKLVPRSGRENDYAADAIAMSGGHIILGAPGSLYATSPGVAYTFRLQGGRWVEGPALAASDWTQPNAFGLSVSLADSLLAIGAPSDTTRGLEAGAVYHFALVDTGWVETRKVFAGNAEPADYLFWNQGSCSG